MKATDEGGSFAKPSFPNESPDGAPLVKPSTEGGSFGTPFPKGEPWVNPSTEARWVNAPSGSMVQR